MERKLLQIAVAFAGLVGVGFGLAGVVFGTAFTDIFDDGAIDSSVRFFKGMLLAIGLIYWSCIPDIERRGERMSLVTFILVCGAASRLMAVIGHGRGESRHPAQPDRGLDPGAAAVAVAAPRRRGRATRRVHLNETRRHLDISIASARSRSAISRCTPMRCSPGAICSPAIRSTFFANRMHRVIRESCVPDAVWCS